MVLIILCENCVEVFYNEKQFLSHKKYKHDGVEKPRPTETRIICEICGDNLEFKSKRKHMKMKHQDITKKNIVRLKLTILWCGNVSIAII